MRRLIPPIRSSKVPDPTRLVVGWTALRHHVRAGGRCTCWICVEETPQREGRRMAAGLRDQAHDESHDRITEQLRSGRDRRLAAGGSR